jgi:hypothetical protein
MIVCLMGQTPEAAFTIPSTLTNIDIIALGTRSALNGFNNKVTVAGTGAGSVRFQDLNFGGGLERSSASTCGIYVYNGSIGVAGFTQSGNGYTEFNATDASNGPNTISSGRFFVNGGKVTAPIVSGTSTFAAINNADVNGNSTVAVGSVLSCILSVWVSAATGFAISSVANSTVLLDGVQFTRPDLASLSTVSLLGFWSIQYTEMNKTASVLTGGTLGSVDWFDNLGLLAVPITTGRPNVLVRDVNGLISEQAITTPLSFNVPISTVYADAAVPTNILLRNISGGSQFTQIGLLCNANGLFNVQQLFSLTASSGQTININGRITFYNLNTITSPSYYVNIQVMGVTTAGQLVNIGASATQTVLNKTQYATTNASFTATDTLVTNLIAIGIQAQVLYGEANNTALINTMFAQLTIS